MSFFMTLFGGQPIVTSPGAAGIFWTGGYKTDAGTQVSEWNAPSIPAVYACVGLISDAIAQLPIHVYETRGNSRRRVNEHPAEYLLNQRPNERMTAFSFRKTQLHHVLLWGNGYGHIQRTAGGDPLAVWLALPDRTSPRLEPTGELKYTTVVDGRSLEFDADEMLHVPAFGFDGIVGYSPVAVARQAMGLARAQESFGARFFANDTKSGGFFKHPGRLGDKALKNLRESLQRQSGPDNAHGVKILEEGLDYIATTINPEDAQFLESREFQVAEIARIFRVPLHMIQSVSGSTSWGSGLAEMSLGFVRFTLSPWMTPIEQELALKLLSQRDRDRGLYFQHDTSDMLKGGLKERADYYTRALSPETGWLDRDEVRVAEDKDPQGDVAPRQAPQDTGDRVSQRRIA